MYFQQIQMYCSSNVTPIKNLMQRHRFHQYLTFLLILLVHIAIILIWQRSASSSNKITNNDKVLLLLALPKQKPTTEVAQQRTLVKAKPRSTITSANKKPIIQAEQITTKTQTPVPISEPNTLSVPAPTAQPLQKNIRELSLSLKDDFLKQEKNFRPDSKSSSEKMKKFSNTLAGVVQSQTEGVVIEKKFAYDGRPVSKVKTPFGTYCVRHPKAGEKLELSPPPLPVSCGQL